MGLGTFLLDVTFFLKPAYGGTGNRYIDYLNRSYVFQCIRQNAPISEHISRYASFP